MATKVTFLNPHRAEIETFDGKVYIMHFINPVNYLTDKQFDGYFTKCMIELFDTYYKGDPKVIRGAITREMYLHHLDGTFSLIDDRDEERVRIGSRIKEIRNALGLDAKDVASIAGIDPANFSRIEQGRFSVGLDILCKIAGALNMTLDFVPKNIPEQ
ncbi:MAG: helix-turn-helix transcriptional regulator [Muribaculaceae bacterium]|nr:helix-turn-helix transcriptional regulator [Muribaculaceae bacterium]